MLYIAAPSPPSVGFRRIFDIIILRPRTVYPARDHYDVQILLLLLLLLQVHEYYTFQSLRMR